MQPQSTTGQPTEVKQPTLASISEERFMSDLAKALRAWRRAGKPAKR